jgi:hypothetical protein
MNPQVRNDHDILERYTRFGTPQAVPADSRGERPPNRAQAAVTERTATP